MHRARSLLIINSSQQLSANWAGTPYHICVCIWITVYDLGHPPVEGIRPCFLAEDGAKFQFAIHAHRPAARVFDVRCDQWSLISVSGRRNKNVSIFTNTNIWCASASTRTHLMSSWISNKKRQILAMLKYNSACCNDGLLWFRKDRGILPDILVFIHRIQRQLRLGMQTDCNQI